MKEKYKEGLALVGDEEVDMSSHIILKWFYSEFQSSRTSSKNGFWALNSDVWCDTSSTISFSCTLHDILVSRLVDH